MQPSTSKKHATSNEKRFKDFKTTFFQCNICEVIFETKEKALEHKALKHENSQKRIKEECKHAEKLSSPYSPDNGLNLHITIADLVKMGGRRRSQKAEGKDPNQL